MDAALALLVLLWGLNFAVVKAGVLGEMHPLSFSVARFVVASIILLALVRWRGEPLGFSRGEWPTVIALGVIGHTVYQLCFVYGLDMTAPGHAALMLGLVPVFVAIVGTVMGIERPCLACWVGILLSFAGIAVVVLGGGEGGGDATVTGDLIVLAGSLAWAIYTVRGRPLLAKHSPLKMTAVTMAAGTVGLTVVGLPAFLAEDWSGLSATAWGAYWYATLGGLVVAYVIWYTGVQKLGGSRTAVYSNLVPVVALAVDWLWLDQRLAPLQVAGALIVFVGVWLARRNGGGQSGSDD